ncbi:transcription initiation factor IIF, beta subunit-domain-containing protein [Lophiotrema nucula]|uniref:Transcription initiation factor IIF subunit beta n=1 Tax=Lophiotrema nucula TaxID=690887 RepID=A0A6A5ZH03_9PLEO|nr:transcription initiation factor IIF, beta subunit-domain-containing protein [Lophiotrema nucula]
MNGIKADPDIKMDTDAITPSGSGYMDDEFYEDTGELTLPPKDADKDVWLTRIPRWLYDAVAKWDDFAEGNDNDVIEIGKVQYFPDQARQGAVSKERNMRIFLNDKWHQRTRLPRGFELSMTNATKEVMSNTYVFTEKDLPGYRPNGYGQGKFGSSQNLSVQDPKARIQKRSRYKKAIPKQTSLLGTTTREYLANPIKTTEYVQFDRQRIKQATLGSNLTTNITNQNEHTLQPAVNKLFKSFTGRTATTKSQLNKYTRIPENELTDILHGLFNEYAYWPMKTLKAKTQQPEAYLKTTLEKIADLVKSGSFASTWRRKDFYSNMEGHTEGQSALAPSLENEDEVVDDEDMEMEDVKI